MKNLFLPFLLLTISSVFSQDKIEWKSNFDEVAKIAQETNKPILANFTGSDWCGWCKVLDREVFSKPEFQKWAKENVVLLEVDFPRRKKLSKALRSQNNALQKAFGVRGYPTIWLFDVGEGKNTKKNIVPHGKTGYVKGGPTKWIKTIAKYMPKRTFKNPIDAVVAVVTKKEKIVTPKKLRVVVAKKITPTIKPFVDHYIKQFYTVESGDTLEKISLKRYGTTTYADKIFTDNKRIIKSLKNLQAGMVLKIPM